MRVLGLKNTWKLDKFEKFQPQTIIFEYFQKYSVPKKYKLIISNPYFSHGLYANQNHFVLGAPKMLLEGWGD